MTRTSITDVRTVGVPVTDQDRALAFYVDALGFEKRLDAPISPTRRWIEVAPPGATTSLALDAAVLTALTGPTQPGVDTGIRFAVPDAAAEHAGLRRLGVQVSDLIIWPGVPPMFTVDDPDGNRFYVVEKFR